jgi:hypothetical protein
VAGGHVRTSCVRLERNDPHDGQRRSAALAE